MISRESCESSADLQQEVSFFGNTSPTPLNTNKK